MLGRDPFGPALDRAVEGKTVAGRRLTVRRSEKLEDLEGCPILFVGSAPAPGLDATLAHIARRPVLTVGESDGFTRAGGMVRLYRAGNHVRFEINLRAALEAGLTLSSRLLAVAGVPASSPGGRQ